MIKELYNSILKGSGFFDTDITLFLLISLAFGCTNTAQDINMSGSFSNQNGNDLPWATDFVRSINISTAAVVNGYYSLNTPDDAIRSVSFILIRTKTIGDRLVKYNPIAEVHYLKSIPQTPFKVNTESTYNQNPG